MKKFTLTAALACLTAAAAAAASPSPFVVMTGAALSSGPHTVVVGEAVAGQAGPAGSWHLTQGQLQGIMEVKASSLSAPAADAPRASACTVYPNPVRDFLTLTREADGAALLNITSLAGATVMALPISGASATVCLSGLPAGVYMLTVTPAGQASSFTTKIIKQ